MGKALIALLTTAGLCFTLSCASPTPPASPAPIGSPAKAPAELPGSVTSESSSGGSPTSAGGSGAIAHRSRKAAEMRNVEVQHPSAGKERPEKWRAQTAAPNLASIEDPSGAETEVTETTRTSLQELGLFSPQILTTEMSVPKAREHYAKYASAQSPEQGEASGTLMIPVQEGQLMVTITSVESKTKIVKLLLEKNRVRQLSPERLEEIRIRLREAGGGG